jgi:hypothetical protein
MLTTRSVQVENNRVRNQLNSQKQEAEIYLKFMQFKKETGLSNTNLVINESNRWIK